MIAIEGANVEATRAVVVLGTQDVSTKTMIPMLRMMPWVFPAFIIYSCLIHLFRTVSFVSRTTAKLLNAMRSTIHLRIIVKLLTLLNSDAGAGPNAEIVSLRSLEGSPWKFSRRKGTAGGYVAGGE